MLKKYLIVNKIKTIALNIIGLLIQLLFIFIIGLYFSASVAPRNYMLLVAIIWTFGLVSIGLFYKYRDWHDEFKTIESPWEMNNLGSRLAAQELLIAFIVNEIIMGAASCILKIITLVKLLYEIRKVSNNEISNILNYFNLSAIDGKRFIRLSEIHFDKNLIGMLISFGVIWTKLDNGHYMVGLNRDYELVLKNKTG